MIYRIFVEKKENLQAKKTRADLDAQLGIAVCEAGHYDTEKGFRTHLHMCLQKELFALQYYIKVEESEIAAAPYRAV